MKGGRAAFLMWVPPIAAILGLAVLSIMLSRLLDLVIFGEVPPLPFGDLMALQNPEAVRGVILSTLEVLAGVFAISITVVAIIVQLSASRISSRVVDLFLADRYNTLVFFMYLLPLVLGFWEANAITDQGYSPVGVGIFMALSTLAMVLVLPYFKYVFTFLQPGNIINKIEASVESSLRQARGNVKRVARARENVSDSIRQLSDISLTAIANNDLVFAVAGLNSIKNAGVFYQRMKPSMPAEWFQIPSNQILGLSEDMWQEVVNDRIWVEMEIFKQYEIAFTNSLRKFRDINSCVARNLREIAEIAAATDTDKTLDFLIKGFNTFIMYALSERDIRSTVNVLYQYRLLAEAILYRPETIGKIAGYFKYYGHNSQRRRIFFIMDAVAYDLRILIEIASERFAPSMEKLLVEFLELDQIAESKEDYKFLRGVRKSQAMLGGFFIKNGRADLAQKIRADMATETVEFLRSVQRDLFSVTSRDFWEIEDRGVTFYYVEEELREATLEFFSWLLEEEPATQDKAASNG